MINRRQLLQGILVVPFAGFKTKRHRIFKWGDYINCHVTKKVVYGPHSVGMNTSFNFPIDDSNYRESIAFIGNTLVWRN